MIGTRTPFRISFVGGGSDISAFYSRHPGCVISAAIDRYMYIFVHPFFNLNIQVKYSKTEIVERIEDIKHPIVREVLRKFRVKGIDINSIADVPAGTGMGSSAAFTVGLMHAMYAYINRYVSKDRLSEEACDLEINKLKEPIGKQDQYAASYGGLNMISFYPDESVNVEPIIMPKGKLFELEDRLLLFYLGKSRSKSRILNKERQNIVHDKKIFNCLVKMTELVHKLRQSLSEGRLYDMGPIMDENWQLKKGLSDNISNEQINNYYKKACKNGATGGKLLGAGGGGFLLFYCEREHQEKLRRALADLREMQFRFDNFGTKIIYVGEYRRGL